MRNKTPGSPINQDPSPASGQPTVPPLAAPASAATRTNIGKTMKIQGEIHSAGELYIDGQVEGKLETNDRLTVGPDGQVNAGIKAREVIVFGSIRGNVEASDKVVIRTGANIVGDIKTVGITIEDGAYFKGGIDITRPPSAKAPGA